MREIESNGEPQKSESSVCLLDGSYFFWETVVLDPDLYLLLQSCDDGEVLQTVEDYLDALRNEEVDEEDPEERELWTVDIPKELQMAMQSKISRLFIDYAKQIAGSPPPDRIN